MLANPTKTFEALAHDVRLAVIRQLMPAGPQGLPAGVIGDRIGQVPNALSFHLGRLANAGLVQMRRVGRNQYYAVDYQQLSALVGFLVEDCCSTAPDGCMPGCPSMPQAAKVRDRQKMAEAS
jgi:DNA-binding transcriptional ArsR family regulator